MNYIILLVLGYSYLLGWLVAKQQEKQIWRKVSDFYETIPSGVCIGLAVLLAGLFCIGNFQSYGISLEAARELVSGEAKQYHGEYLERKELFQNTEMRNVEVDPYSVKPYLLFFDDITDDPENWKNTGVSDFYDKDTVRLNRYDPEVDYD
ncbi:MAG: hypothetical protein KH452_03515 [Clostridiales bacterium]|nr:hypothetical protein [Clostridiales bacterium]